jgi:pyruvate-ferredoxin/flavodoxin oxidoreductase
VKDFVDAIPKTVKHIAVLDRCKEPNGIGEPLYMDVLSAVSATWKGNLPRIIGGRYGLASKEFTPAMAKAVFDELKKEVPKNQFTVGIDDDVTNTSLGYDPHLNLEKQHLFPRIVFWTRRGWNGKCQQKFHQDHWRHNK